MRIAVVTILAALMGVLACLQSAEARVRVRVDLASQTMHVSSASGDYVWPISSARSGFRTPRGTYGVQRMEVMHRSRKYHNSPMPHSIFFNGGYAIHGTYAVGALGQPASHGCIRLAPQNAAALYQMVRREGAQIAINGTAPTTQRLYAAAKARHYARERSRGTLVYAAGEPRRGYATYSTYPYQAQGYASQGYAADGGDFYLRPALGYAPQPRRGLADWLSAPDAW